MDFRQIEAFVHVYRLRSFSLAANALYLTQPTVSSHINELEAELGIKLFDRSSREIVPTGAANHFYQYAVNILETRASAIHSLHEYGNRIAGRLEIAVSTIPGQYLLPKILTAFHALYPDITYLIRQGDTREIVREIERKHYQIGIVGAVMDDQKLEYKKIAGDRMLLITSPATGQQLCQETKELPAIALQDLQQMPFILRERGSATRQEFENALKNRGINPASLPIVAEMNSNEAIKHAVREGLGVSVVSALSVEDELRLGLIRAFAIDELHLHRSFYLLTHKGHPLSPCVTAFQEFVLEYFADSSKPLPAD